MLDALVKRHGAVTRAEVDAHFHPLFLDQIAPDKLLAFFAQMGGQLTAVALGEVHGDANGLAAAATIDGEKFQIVLAIDPASRQITTLAFRPDNTPRLKSFDEALRTIATLAPRAQLLVAALDKTGCHPLQELATTDELAIGSTFKLYVLLALADRIAAGKAKWTDEIAIRDEWKSLPSGTTQNEPPGKKLTLATLAERMISISDNTAADHLLYTLGRKEVEATVRAAQHARPALDAPFLSTRELFVLKLGQPDELDRYLKLSESRRRDYLDKTLADKYPKLAASGEWTTARRVDKLEWFASSDDLCRTMAALWTRAQDPRTKAVLDMLSKNPGPALDKAVWTYVGYKGGSEPGVLNTTYLLRRSDDRWFVVTAGFNAAEGTALDDRQLLTVISGVIELLGSRS